MSTPIQRYVNVVISKQTAATPQKGFGVIGIVGVNLTTGRTARFSDLASVAAALDNGVNDPEYRAAQDCFGQLVPPSEIMIIHKEDAETYTEALNAAILDDSGFYGVVLTSRTLADQKLVVQWVQSNERAFAVADDSTQLSGDAPSTDHIAQYVKDNSYSRSFVIYHGAAATQFIEAAFLTKMLVEYKAGEADPAHKILLGVTADSLNTGQLNSIEGFYASHFTETGGKNRIFNGRGGDGDYFDLLYFMDWLKARTTEILYDLLGRFPKMFHDDSGYAQVEDALTEVFSQAKTNQAIGNNQTDDDGKLIGGYRITIPPRSEVSISDIAAKVLNNVNFLAIYKQGFTTINVNGVVSFGE